MMNLKKTAVAVLAFGSSAVFAGSMGPVCTPGNVTVPCASTAWDFGVQALYLKPSYSGFGYNGGSSSTVSAGGVSTVTDNYNGNPNNWGWGFKLEGSYHFRTGNDVNLNWYHLDHTANQSFVNVGTTTAGGVFTGFPAVTASSQTKWDAVNLEFGQLAHFGEWKNIRFHGGAQYANVQANNDLDTLGFTTTGTPAATAVGSFDRDSKFNGFGPRIGADFSYNWGNGFAMYANGASALLVGTQKFTNNYATGTTATATSALYATGSRTAIVPEFEAKLGLAYTYAMAQGDLSLDLGWMWVDYLNVLHSGTGVTAASLTPTSAFGASTKESNFGVQGPFVGLKWVGNVA